MITAYLLSGKDGEQSMLIALDELFPECKALTKDTELSRLSCWTLPGSCHRGSFTTCMTSVVDRAYKIFAGMPELHLIILHWEGSHKKAPDKLRRWGLIVERDENKEMKISTLNKWAVSSIEARLGEKYRIVF